jgi:hypothetical protein
MQLLYFPANFLHPFILGLLSVKPSKQARNASHACNSASNPALTVKILVTNTLASVAHESQSTLDATETIARGDNHVATGCTLDHANAVGFNTLAFQHLHQPLSG